MAEYGCTDITQVVDWAGSNNLIFGGFIDLIGANISGNGAPVAVKYSATGEYEVCIY